MAGPDNLHKNIPTDQRHNPKGFEDAGAGSILKKSPNNELLWRAETWKRPVTDFVDGSLTPPDESDERRYVLVELTGSVVDSGWDGAAFNDVVEYDVTNSIWGIVTPSKEDVLRKDADSTEYYFDGTNWTEVISGIGGTIAANQVLYGLDSSNAQSSSNWTFDGSNNLITDGSTAQDNRKITGSHARNVYSSASTPKISDQYRMGRGTLSSKAASQSGDDLYEQNHYSYDGSSDSQVFSAVTSATETHSSGNLGVSYSIYTTTNGTGSIAERFKIQGDGSIQFNNAFAFPTSDGSAGQALKTDGAGSISFGSVVGTSGTPAANYLPVFSDADTITGDTTLQYYGAALRMENTGASEYRSISSSNSTTAAARFQGRRSTGGVGSEGAVTSGDYLTDLMTYGHDGTSYVQSSSLRFLATETWSGSQYGTEFSLNLTPSGSTTSVERYAIDGSGTHTWYNSTSDYLELSDSSGLKHLGSGEDVNWTQEVYKNSGAVENVITQRAAQGTSGAPSDILLGNTIGEFKGAGYYSSAFTTTFNSYIKATENWGASAKGTEYYIETVATGGTALTERFHIQGNGAIQFNNAYEFPTSDGTSGQVLETNGSGTLTWSTPSSGGPSFGNQYEIPFSNSGGTDFDYAQTVSRNFEMKMVQGELTLNGGSPKLYFKKLGTNYLYLGNTGGGNIILYDTSGVGKIGLGYGTSNYFNVTGGISFGQNVTPTGHLDIAASTTSLSHIRMRPGNDPSSPQDGDFWFDGTNLKFRDGGTTRTIDWT